MGKRSRRQGGAPGSAGGKGAAKPSLKQRADEASKVAEKRIKERPAAPWDPFPLTELAIFSGIVLLVVGVLVGGQTGKGLIAAGVVLACIGGLETALREHFGGYRPHSGLLAGVAAFAAVALVSLVLGATVPVRAAAGVGVFALVFPTLRSAFIRKSGGRGVL